MKLGMRHIQDVVARCRAKHIGGVGLTEASEHVTKAA